MAGYRIGQGTPAGAIGARARLARAVGPLLLGVAAFEGSACAMRPADRQTIDCSIENQQKLPPELRQDEAVCGPIGRAVQAAAGEAKLSAESVAVKVRVMSPSLLAVTVNVNGAALPEQKLGSSDRQLSARSIEMLASAVARQLAEYGASRR